MRIFPEVCARTLCPFSSSTRNMALGSGSTTVPSRTMASSLGFGRTLLLLELPGSNYLARTTCFELPKDPREGVRQEIDRMARTATNPVQADGPSYGDGCLRAKAPCRR